MQPKLSLMWFRQDLRVLDNPAFAAACESAACLPIYIDDDAVSAGDFAAGAASRIWLHKSLVALNDALGGGLQCFQGDARTILSELLARHRIEAVYWNRCYAPWQIARDQTIKSWLLDQGTACRSFNGSLLLEPWELLKADGAPYRIFTPYYRAGHAHREALRALVSTPRIPKLITDAAALPIDALGLVEAHPYANALSVSAEAGAQTGLHKLDAFIASAAQNYQHQRDFPGVSATSKLSPHLHFGEISPHQVWHAVQAALAPSHDRECFLRELVWREFSYYVLYHFPQLPETNLRSQFDAFPWREHAGYFQAWCRGQTGYPVIDAGMRELWQTGWMHNRVRMLVASFLVKNLRIHWRQGAAWFWDCLFDADLASNSASWQWVAGSGCDAAPYFRIFNPVTQGKKFDPDGHYVRRFVPEIAALPTQYLHAPWEAPLTVLAEANVQLGDDYPLPIVDLQQSRIEALEAFQLCSD